MRSSSVKQAFGIVKPYLRWLVLGATLWFIASALRQNWQDVQSLRLRESGWSWLGMGLGITLLAHIWTGWVWNWILRELGQSTSGLWGIRVYLTTNIAKYLPGNVWHLYGRVMAAKQAGVSASAATLSVLLEPLLMAAAALIITLTNAQRNWPLQLLCLVLVLVAIHPRALNPLLKLARQVKGQAPDQSSDPLQVRRYPLLPLLGEIGFVGLRGVGFLLTVWALAPVKLEQFPVLFSAFSLAWVTGLVIPGAPGGIGVFEATALALLSPQFPTSLVLGSVVLYRAISLLAELIGAVLASLAGRKRR
jgi:glycosyltransferase 2 family protein